MSRSRQTRIAERYDNDEALAEKLVRQQDRNYWALYRATDMSQGEVRDAVPSEVDTSQSTVSRVAKEGDSRALTEPDFVNLGGGFVEDDLGMYPEEWLEALRDVFARALADRRALNEIAKDRPTPEWAAKRFPELVGCHHYVSRVISNDLGHDHDASEDVDESHLSHLESVNTERWK